MWIDIMTPEEASANPPEEIKPPEPAAYELRVLYDFQLYIFHQKIPFFLNNSLEWNPSTIP